jgi:hypothetical protein
MTIVRCKYADSLECMISASREFCHHVVPHVRDRLCSYPYCIRDGEAGSYVHNCQCNEAIEDETEENSKM